MRLIQLVLYFIIGYLLWRTVQVVIRMITRPSSKSSESQVKEGPAPQSPRNRITWTRSRMPSSRTFRLATVLPRTRPNSRLTCSHAPKPLCCSPVLMTTLEDT